MKADGTLTFQPNESWQQLSLQAVVIDSAGHQRNRFKVAATTTHRRHHAIKRYRITNGTVPNDPDGNSVAVPRKLEPLRTPVETTDSSEHRVSRIQSRTRCGESLSVARRY